MTQLCEIRVPDVGNVAEIDVVEVLIKVGDTVEIEQTVATLETDKASMDLPSSANGSVQEVFIKPGDKVSEGTLIATVLVSDAGSAPAAPAPVVAEAPKVEPVVEKAPEPVVSAPAPSAPTPAPVAAPAVIIETTSTGKAHASPSTRLFARELGVDVSKITLGTGRKGRILKDDVKSYVKKALTEGGAVAGTGAGIPSIPAVDFSPFGETELLKLSKIKRLTGQNLSRVWLNLPLVTYHEEADITEMEAFRNSLNAEKVKGEVKITGLIFSISSPKNGLFKRRSLARIQLILPRRVLISPL